MLTKTEKLRLYKAIKEVLINHDSFDVKSVECALNEVKGVVSDIAYGCIDVDHYVDEYIK